MGRLRLVVNMKTFQVFLFTFFLASTTAARFPDPEISDEFQEEDFLGKHNGGPPDDCNEKGCDKNHERCEDDDGDGHWECSCGEGYTRDNDGLCEISNSAYQDGSNGVYRVVKISKKVFYFGRKSESFTDAVEVCKQAFQGNGKLFEPKSNKMNTAIGALAQFVSNNNPFWIGVRTRPHNEGRVFYYLSENPSKDIKNGFTAWSAGEPNDISGKEDCVAILNNNAFTWETVDCDQADTYAICSLTSKRHVANLSLLMTITVMMKTIRLPVIMMVEHAVIETDGNSKDGRIIAQIVNVWILVQGLNQQNQQTNHHVLKMFGLLKNAKNATRRNVVRTRNARQTAKRHAIYARNIKKSVKCLSNFCINPSVEEIFKYYITAHFVMFLKSRQC